MQSINYDVQIVILSYVNPEDIYTLYNTSEILAKMMDELASHKGFVVPCRSIITNELLIWFQKKNIKLYLIQEYKRNNEGLKNGNLHRDNDLPAVILAGEHGIKIWYQHGKIYRDNGLPAYVDKYNKHRYKNGLLH